MQAFSIDMTLPGFNELINAAKATWGKRKYNELKLGYQIIIAAAIRQAGLTPWAEPVFLSFHWREPNQRRDKDNIAGGGQKLILDALRACGILKNDGWRDVLGFVHIFTVDEAHPGVTVRLTGAVPTPEEAVGDEALRPASGH